MAVVLQAGLSHVVPIQSPQSVKKFFIFIFQLSGWALIAPSCFALYCCCSLVSVSISQEHFFQTLDAEGNASWLKGSIWYIMNSCKSKSQQRLFFATLVWPWSYWLYQCMVPALLTERVQLHNGMKFVTIRQVGIHCYRT